jgi:broad specificity phosphatase PhoE
LDEKALTMNIFLIRHGESLAQSEGKQIHQEMADHAIPLSERGHEQAREAGRFLRTHVHKRGHIEFRLWLSPYKRTRETADELERVLSPSRMMLDRREHVLLCEQQFGLFDGIFDRDLANKYPKEYAHYDKCERFGGRFWARMPLGESRFDVAQRVHQAFGTFHRDAEKHDVRDLIIVCHGVTLRAFVMMWCHKSPEWFESEPNPPNCAIRHIRGQKDLDYIYEGSR